MVMTAEEDRYREEVFGFNYVPRDQLLRQRKNGMNAQDRLLRGPRSSAAGFFNLRDV
jgi:hypothetical protein